MLLFGNPKREIWDKNGIPLDSLTIPIMLENEQVGEISLWLDYTTGNDGKIDLRCCTSTTVYGPLSSDDVDRIGFRLDMENKTI